VADARKNDKLMELSVKIPANVLGDVDADEIRVAIEEFVEKFLKMIVRIDDSVMCEPASTTIYQTTYVWAERIDACYGVHVPTTLHIHAVERYGKNMNECFYSVEIFAERVDSDESG